MRDRSSYSRLFLIPALALMLVVLGLAMPPQAISSGLSDGGMIEEWVTTERSLASAAKCLPSEECQELCLVGVNGIVPTGQLCCVAGGECQDPL